MEGGDQIMSKQVDDRVVEMRFDNKQFESATKESMTTLDKLKQKLQLKDAAKGLENQEKAAKKVDLNPLGKSVDTVTAKFSAMQVAGATAIANLTNSAVNAGKNITKAFTIDPIKTGFQEYETQINAVQTILANTESKGTTLQQVNAALDELNKYASNDVPKSSPILHQLLDITERGRSLGIVWFGAEQFVSDIHKRVKGNCATHAFGRTNSIEITKEDFRFIPPVYKTMLTRLKQGEYIIQNPVFRSLLCINFPYPIYKYYE